MIPLRRYVFLGILTIFLLLQCWVFFETRSFRTWCLVKECCNKKWILQDYEGVKKSLQENLFGQHLVQNVIYASLKGHVIYQPEKPLVLSFHGGTGTGKTVVSKFIAKGWFQRGVESKFVHMFSATKDFPHKSSIKDYVNVVRGNISSHTRSCGHQIFIFEEVDSFPLDVLPSIRYFLEYYGTMDGVDYANTIFIFLSNAGDENLKTLTANAYKNNHKRESLQQAEAERLLTLDVFNTKGRTVNRLIDKHLINHLVPFFPLERPHVRKCIEAELKRRKLQMNVKVVDDVMNELQFEGPDNVFSIEGCKKVAAKLDFVLSSVPSIPKQEL